MSRHRFHCKRKLAQNDSYTSYLQNLNHSKIVQYLSYYSFFPHYLIHFPVIISTDLSDIHFLCWVEIMYSGK